MTDRPYVFAVPGENSIIDSVEPDGRSTINRETLEEVQRRYPNAVRIDWESWRQEQITKQETPIAWTPIGQRQYQEMLEVLPPAIWTANGFLVGEPTDHSFANGRPRFQAFIARYGSYFTSSRPLTVEEFRRLR